jgi:hypothetical protein
MAIIKTSGLISDIRGSINGSTFQRSASGLVMRSKPVSVGRGTNSQNNIRNINSQLNFAWQNLSQAQRDLWGSYAIFLNGPGISHTGSKSANTGRTQFFGVNFWLLQYGKSILNVPTFTTALAPAIPCPPLFNQSDTLQNSSYNLNPAQEILVTRVSLPQSLATNTANTGFRTLVYTQVHGTIQNWLTAYFNTFGINLMPNKKYWVSYMVVNFITGAISAETKSLVLFTGTPTPPAIGTMVIGSTFIVS